MASGCRIRAGQQWICWILGPLLALASAWVVPSAVAEEQQPYRAVEFVVAQEPDDPYQPVIDGDRVFWGPVSGEADRLPRITIYYLSTGQKYVVNTPKLALWPIDVDGDRMVTTEDNGIYLYHLPDAARIEIAAPRADLGFGRGPARISGDTIVWTEGFYPHQDVYAYSLSSTDTIRLSTQSTPKDGLTLRRDTAAWVDRRNVVPEREEADIYAYDLTAKRELRLTASSRYVSFPAITDGLVVWATSRAGMGWIEGHDLAEGAPVEVTPTMATADRPTAVAADGDIVAWSAPGPTDDDIWGYDLKLRKAFIVTRAIGGQRMPSVDGKTVVWSDWRHSGVGKYKGNVDIYGARLEPGPAEPPPILGAPSSTDAKIEIVWPHGNAPVTEASKANIAVWLFQSDTDKLQSCQWSPTVRLWRSLNNEPGEMVGVGRKSSGHYFAGNRAIPTWEFNDVDVSAARDPGNRLFFWVTVDGVPTRSNVWAHAADPRTYFPQQDVPAGVGQVGDSVAAKIEIVWPHDNAPVNLAKYANISAALFVPGSMLSVPPSLDNKVRLFRALNNGFLEPVTIGSKRLVGEGSATYPLWDFNDVDVSKANDPGNKYYFTLSVDDLNTFSNVWAHGADPRTYFPQMDTPPAACE